MGSITALASKYLHASCAVGICVARAYLESVLSVLGCWRCQNFRGAAGAVLGTSSYGAVMGPGNGTVGSGAVMGTGDVTLGCGDVVRAIVVIYVASILCRVFMACICSPPTYNGDAGAGLLIASAKSSNSWRAASAEDSFENGQLCGKNFIVLIILSARVAGK